jgi:hypothetical protein
LLAGSYVGLFQLHIGCMFKYEHRFHCIGVARFDVARLHDSYIRVPQDGLDRLIRNSESVQVCRQSSSKSMPPVPLKCGLDKSSADDIASKPWHAHGLAQRSYNLELADNMIGR